MPNTWVVKIQIIYVFLHGIDMRHLTLSLGLLLISLPGFAHGPTPQKAVESIIIHAPVSKVWSLVKQFDAIANWHADLKKSEGDDRNESGGKRSLTFQNSESLTEELDYYNEQDGTTGGLLRTLTFHALSFCSCLKSKQDT
jgi:mxaD protein